MLSRTLLSIVEESKSGESCGTARSSKEVVRMLVLSRKVGQRIWIGNEIAVKILRVAGGAVRIGVEAPEKYSVIREELKPLKAASDSVVAANRGSAQSIVSTS